MFKFFSFICGFLLLQFTLEAQNVGIGTNAPDPSAKLDISSTTQGLLAPRLSTTQRNSIASPAEGLIIYNTSQKVYQYYNGICWLNAHQSDCADCTFGMTFSQASGTIDRLISDNVSTQINVTQTSGTAQNIAFQVTNTLPQGMTVSFNSNPQMSTGSVTMTASVEPTIAGGTYPVIIQAFCGSYSRTIIYSVVVEPCYRLAINNNHQNFNLGSSFYNRFPSASRSQPVCVIAEVEGGMIISSDNASNPAFNGNGLPNGSYLVLINNGYILGKGGNAGRAYSPTAGTTGEGQDGGTALRLSDRTHIQNNLGIYGGGGGGNAMAFEISWTPPSPANFVTLGIFLGSGGGGGAGGPNGGIGGAGGTSPTSLIGLSYYSPGTDGTAGPAGVGGQGGSLNYPIALNLGPVSIDLNPGASGGNGGDYGFPGTQGLFDLRVNASVVINIPFVGPITIPVANNVAIPIPVPPPAAGDAGHAIKRNGNNCNIPDTHYTTSGIKGKVAN